jgi:hypothetical protein
MTSTPKLPAYYGKLTDITFSGWKQTVTGNYVGCLDAIRGGLHVQVKIGLSAFELVQLSEYELDSSLHQVLFAGLDQLDSGKEPSKPQTLINHRVLGIEQ